MGVAAHAGQSRGSHAVPLKYKTEAAPSPTRDLAKSIRKNRESDAYGLHFEMKQEEPGGSRRARSGRGGGQRGPAPSERHRASGTERAASSDQHASIGEPAQAIIGRPPPLPPLSPGNQASPTSATKQARQTEDAMHTTVSIAAEVTNNLFKQAFVITLEARVTYVRRYERLAHDRRATAAASGRWRSSRACRTRAAATRSSRTTT